MLLLIWTMNSYLNETICSEGKCLFGRTANRTAAGFDRKGVTEYLNMTQNILCDWHPKRFQLDFTV